MTPSDRENQKLRFETHPPTSHQSRQFQSASALYASRSLWASVSMVFCRKPMTLSCIRSHTKTLYTREFLLRLKHRRLRRSFNVRDLPLLTDFQRKRVHAFFDSVLCFGDGQMAEASENHEHMGVGQGEFHVMQSAKSAESLQNLKSMSPMFRLVASEPEFLEHYIYYFIAT